MGAFKSSAHRFLSLPGTPMERAGMAAESQTAAAPVPRAAGGEARRLGAYLPASQDAIERALAGGGEGVRLGEALVKAGLVTREQLLDAVHRQRADRLRQCQLFARLSDAELAKLATLVSEVSVGPNEQFLAQDSAGNAMYVLASGR